MAKPVWHVLKGQHHAGNMTMGFSTAIRFGKQNLIRYVPGYISICPCTMGNAIDKATNFLGAHGRQGRTVSDNVFFEHAP